MPLVALTGGIGAGKSTVAARLADHGAVVVDADRLAREVVEPGEPALDAIRARFGDAVFQADGRLDRTALGRIVFADAAARTALNAITHPAVQARSAALFREAFARDPRAVVIYDVPLIDARGTAEFDLVVVADAPAGIRVRRLVEQRGMREEDAAARVASQLSDADRRALADVLLDTGGTMETTIAQTDALWTRLSAWPETPRARRGR